MYCIARTGHCPTFLSEQNSICWTKCPSNFIGTYYACTYSFNGRTMLNFQVLHCMCNPYSRNHYMAYVQLVLYLYGFAHTSSIDGGNY